MSLPEAFIKRFREIYPKHAEALLETFEKPKPVSFRVNPLKSDVKTALHLIEKMGIRPYPVEWYDHGFIVDSRFREILTHSGLFSNGEIYIQGLSSMVAPLVLEPKPGETVLDLAASPGGKSLMIAALMQNRGILSVVEPGKERFFRLKSNLERGAVTIAKFYMCDGRGVGNKCPSMFDRVLLDAPCSTEAKFRSYSKKSYAYWSERKIKEMSKLQTRLLLSAVKSLKPGGSLLYATCSFEPEENEAVVDKVLKKVPALKVSPLFIPVKNIHSGFTSWRNREFDPSLAKTVRILPSKYMDGFYLAKLTL